MNQRNQSILVVLLLAGLHLAGCGESVQLGNLPGRVTFVGPSVSNEVGVTTFFGVADAEGDLLSATVEVCDGSGQSCRALSSEEGAEAQLLAGSASLSALPTVVGTSTSAALRVNWRDCGLFASADLFTVRVEVLGSDLEALTSAPVALEDLGLDLSGICP